MVSHYLFNSNSFLFFFISLFQGHGKDHIDGHHSVLQIASRRYGTENKCMSPVELLEAARIEETMQMKKRSNKDFSRIFEVSLWFYFTCERL